MKILYNLGTGALSSLKSWKGIVISWLITFLMISLVAIPVRSGFKSMLGSSMITELLQDTINVDVITDLLRPFANIFSALTTGFFLLVFLAFIVNSFLTGGLFSILSSSEKEKSGTRFFSGAASNFWSVTIITLISGIIMSFVLGIVFSIPFMMGSGENSGSPIPSPDGSAMRISLILVLLLLPVMLLAADYARAWQVQRSEKKPFSAIGFGFGRTFKTFLSSYPMMLLLVLIQAGFVWFVLKKLMASTPSTGGALFMFFILSQLLFILRLWLRTWRYASVTAAMEAYTEKIVQFHTEPVNVSDQNIDSSENNPVDLT